MRSGDDPAVPARIGARLLSTRTCRVTNKKRAKGRLALRFLPCEAGEGDHAKHGGGGSLTLDKKTREEPERVLTGVEPPVTLPGALATSPVKRGGTVAVNLAAWR